MRQIKGGRQTCETACSNEAADVVKFTCQGMWGAEELEGRTVMLMGSVSPDMLRHCWRKEADAARRLAPADVPAAREARAREAMAACKRRRGMVR